jgi:hypothetical protein
MDTSVFKRIFTDNGILARKTQFQEGYVKGKGERDVAVPVAVSPVGQDIEQERLRNENANLLANNVTLNEDKQTLENQLQQRLIILERFHIGYNN